MGDLIHKTKVVPFLDTGNGNKPDWTQIKKSTTFTLATNPQTKTFDFISSEQPEEEIDSYQPSLAQSLTMFKGEPDYQLIFDMLYALPTGAAAHRDALVVFYKEKALFMAADGETEVYKAWKIDALVKINQMDTVNENIDFDLSFNEIKRGAVKIGADGKPYFVEGVFDSGVFTPNDGEAFPVAAVPEFTGGIADETYTLGDTAITLDGTAETSDGGIITYRWYKDGIAIAGAAGATYTPSTAAAGSHVYKVVAVNTVDGATAKAEASATITVEAPAETPVFAHELSDAAYHVGDTADALDAAASTSDGGDITYSWKDAEGNEVADTASFIPPTSAAGPVRYTVTATNTISPHNTATAQASVTITVEAAQAAAPVFSAPFTDAIQYAVGDTPTPLDGTATASDGGIITYQWYTVADGTDTAIDGETGATLTPTADSAGETVYKVIATNTLGSSTATAEQSVTVNVAE